MSFREQLRDISTAELAAEVARRLAGRKPRAAGAHADGAAAATPPRPRFATKADWAQDQASQFKKTRDTLLTESAPDGAQTQRKLDQVACLNEQITKYERMAQAYKRKGL